MASLRTLEFALHRAQRLPGREDGLPLLSMRISISVGLALLVVGTPLMMVQT